MRLKQFKLLQLNQMLVIWLILLVSTSMSILPAEAVGRVDLLRLEQQAKEARELGQQQQENAMTTKLSQGMLTTHTIEFKNSERRVGRQENVYDDNGDGKDGEGGTSVILSNLNSVENWEDNKLERDLALEAAKKRGEEQRTKEDFSNTQRENSAKARQEADKEHKMQAKKREESREKAQDEAQEKRAAEHKKKREKREEESEKQSKKREEQTAKREAATEKESKEKSEKREEEGKKRQQQKEEEARASLRLASWRLTHNTILRSAADIPFKGAFTYMFFIRPYQIVGGWGNIMLKGQQDINRNPAVWFYPGQLRLHVRSGTAQNPTWHNGGNNGCDPSGSLPLNGWTHFAMIHDGIGLKVYYNANLVCSANIGGPVGNGGPLYVADPWHQVAGADLADFRYYPRAVEFSVIQQASKDRRGL